MTTNINSLNAYSYSNVFTGNAGHAAGKLFVPVQPNEVIHTQFDHVAGVAAAPKGEGVSVSKIKILDTLIDQLVALKNESAEVKELKNTDTNTVDALIKQYQEKLSQAMNQAKSNPFMLPGAVPQKGRLFSFDV
jgi:hypothetical protein